MLGAGPRPLVHPVATVLRAHASSELLVSRSIRLAKPPLAPALRAGRRHVRAAQLRELLRRAQHLVRSRSAADEEIRLGRMTREKGISLVEAYDDASCDEYIDSFCAYIDIPVTRFWEQVRASVNQELFSVDRDGSIRRKFKVGIGL